ncbi:MAG: nucleotide exchange factor GrpE [Candidatus Bathyarchaeota archaeon]|nr:nucleotide exchange factor GrpE [Candidatus Bathyarchaeota archaeon]
MTPKKRAKKPSKSELEARVKELEKSLNEAESNAEKYLSQLKYAKADLENTQKQSKRVIEDVMNRANGSLLQQLLPMLDELELLTTKDGEKEKLVEGVEMVFKKLQKLMETHGVTPVEALGYPFDPFKHEALLEVESIEEPDGYVLEEIRRGYTFKDRVLRASVVKVARSPKDEIEEDSKDE